MSTTTMTTTHESVRVFRPGDELPARMPATPALFIIDCHEGAWPDVFDEDNLEAVYKTTDRILITTADPDPAAYDKSIEECRKGQRTLLIRTNKMHVWHWVDSIAHSMAEGGDYPWNRLEGLIDFIGPRLSILPDQDECLVAAAPSTDPRSRDTAG